MTAGQETTPPSSSNKAAKGKDVWVISTGQASPSAAAAAQGVTDAGKVLGWQMHLYDAQLNPSNYAVGIDDAIQNHANGIVLDAIDCPLAKAPLEKAKAAGIETVGIFALDCNEAPGGGPQLFSVSPGFGTAYPNLKAAYEEWGSDAAAAIIAETKGHANVLNFTNDQYDILIDYQAGFEQRMAQCTTCKVVGVPWLASDFGAQLTSITEAAITKDPGVNAIQAGSNPTLGITQGVIASGKKSSLYVVGGLGLAGDLAALSSNSGLSAVVAWPTEWYGYAVADTLNSAFNGTTPAVDEGVGWQLLTSASKNIPTLDGNFNSSVAYAQDFKTRWGV